MLTIKAKDLALIALFAALTAIGGFLSIPTPGGVSFSLQFLFCAYAGILLGSKRGAISQLLYVALGLLGLPIFAIGGGVSYVFDPSFGFLIAFIPAAFVMGFITEKKKSPSGKRLTVAVISGLVVTYLIGVPYLYFMVNYLADPGDEITFATAIVLGFTPFILFDLIKCAIVVFTSRKVISRLQNLYLLDQ